MKLDADFPGGNVIVEKVEGLTAVLRPDLRDTEGDWFYWAFRVREAAGKQVDFTFSQKNVLAARGPAASWDGGRTWRWLGADSLTGGGFTCQIPVGVEEAFFSMTIPYLQADWEAFLARPEIGQAAGVISGVLCHTPKGRAVETLELRCLGAEVKARVILTARHHSCETMASHTLEGMIEQILTMPTLRESTEFLIVPFVDKDGCEDGDQGKNRRGRDHNRDYDGASQYAETAALRTFLPRWSDGLARVALDFHCPWIKGGINEIAYFVGNEDPGIWEQQVTLFTEFERAVSGPIPFHVQDGLPFGQDWNTARNYASGLTCVRFAAGLPGMRCVATLEIPYANAGGAEVNARTARSLGRDIARGLAAYLEKLS